MPMRASGMRLEESVTVSPFFHPLTFCTRSMLLGPPASVTPHCGAVNCMRCRRRHLLFANDGSRDRDTNCIIEPPVDAAYCNDIA